VNITIATNNSDLLVTNLANCVANYSINGINQGPIGFNEYIIIPSIITTANTTVAFACETTSTETVVNVNDSYVGGSYAIAFCYGNTTTLNVTSFVSQIQSAYCCVEASGQSSFISIILDRTSPSTFVTSFLVSDIYLPTLANVSVSVAVSITPPFGNRYFIPRNGTFYTPIIWSKLQLITNLFCSFSYYAAYGQFIITNYYAFNFSINGVMQLTNWTLPTTPNSVSFYIPLNGSYSFTPGTQFNYYSLLQRSLNGDITTIYYYGTDTLPTNFFINNTCPVIHPTKPPGHIDFPWWAWLLTVGGAALIGGILALVIIRIARAYNATSETQRLT